MKEGVPFENVPPETGPDGITPSGDFNTAPQAAELTAEVTEAENELFLDKEMLLNTISGAWRSMRGEGDQGDPDVREQNIDGTLTPYGVIQKHKDRYLGSWARLLLEEAQQTNGGTRAMYARVLKELCYLVGEDVFTLATKNLHISPQMIEDLAQKGKEENEGSHFNTLISKY